MVVYASRIARRSIPAVAGSGCFVMLAGEGDYFLARKILKPLSSFRRRWERKCWMRVCS